MRDTFQIGISHYFSPLNRIYSAYLSFFFELSLILFRTVYDDLAFIRLVFKPHTAYIHSTSYLYPYMISPTFPCFLAFIFIVPPG